MGVDGGTQSSKVSIYTLEGELICSSSQRLKPLYMPKLGVAEHPDDDVWESIAAACRATLNKFEGQPDEIIAVGLCTIRCCRAELNGDGKLASPMLNWMDARLNQAYQRHNQNTRYVTSSSGYITHRLTGEFKDTSANYEGQWPIDKRAWDWSNDAALQAGFNLKPSELFELVNPAQILGRVTKVASDKTGLPEGLVVVATANDKAVEALGSGLSAYCESGSSKRSLLSLGTYITAMSVGDELLENAEHFFTNLACIPQHYLYECSGIRHGMGTVSWYRDLFGAGLVDEAQGLGLSAEALLNQEAAQIPLGSDGLLTLPEWLAPVDQKHKRGAMIGLHAGHRRAHLYRSLLESIAMTMCNNLMRMEKELGQWSDAPATMIVSGGGSKSALFMQILADVFNRKVICNRIADAAGLGSAICAAVAMGAHDSFQTAIDAMVHEKQSYTPNSQAVDFYQRLNTEVFSQLSSATDHLLKLNHSFYNA